MQAGGVAVLPQSNGFKEQVHRVSRPFPSTIKTQQASSSQSHRMGDDGNGLEEAVQLENSWCIWLDKYAGPANLEEYEASLQKLCTFSTIQDFWKNFNNLPSTDKLKLKSSFHLMKAGIRPIWEDPENANGGFWAVRVRREDTELTWKELVLAAIGEQFGPVLSNVDDICGVSVSPRQYDYIIQVWNANASANVNAVLARIKSIVPGVDLRNPFYKAHREHTAFNTAKTSTLKK